MSGNINPDRARYQLFKDFPRDCIIHMLNLVRLNETAVYEDGTMVSGREAYAAYGRGSGPVFQKLGGRIIWSGKYDLTLIGPEDENWDIAFIAEYPNAEAFMAMIKDEDYQRAVKHRTAAVKDSRLIRLGPVDAGNTFG